MSELRQSLVPSQLLTLVPRVLERGTVQGRTVLLETKLPGIRLNRVGASELRAAAAAVTQLHRSTDSAITVDDAVMRDWVDIPIGRLRQIKPLNGADLAFGRLTETLYSALLGQHVIASRVHGDYWLGNILLLPDGERVKVTGIVDWENARRVGLPDCDLIHLWLTSQPSELGSTVRRARLFSGDCSDCGRWVWGELDQPSAVDWPSRAARMALARHGRAGTSHPKSRRATLAGTHRQASP